MASPGHSVILVDGPWEHREVAANGAKFHTVEAGDGPLVLLLHGFPEFWWSWRHQLTGLAAAGLRAVAPDLRGYGASDKPPRGYDLPTLAADIAGLIRALGERDAIVVGHDWGALGAWTAATLHPSVVRRLAIVSMPHPLRLRRALLTDSEQRRASAYALAFQTPRWGEHLMTRRDAAYVGGLLRGWSGPAWPTTPDFAEAERRNREAVRVPHVAHSALEYYRWALRSLARPDGLRYAAAMETAVTAPTLQIHGALDPCVLPRTVEGSDRWVRAPYQLQVQPGVGHFPHQEAPDAVTSELLAFCSD